MKQNIGEKKTMMVKDVMEILYKLCKMPAKQYNEDKLD